MQTQSHDDVTHEVNTHKQRREEHAREKEARIQEKTNKILQKKKKDLGIYCFYSNK